MSKLVSTALALSAPMLLASSAAAVPAPGAPAKAAAAADVLPFKALEKTLASGLTITPAAQAFAR